MQQSNQPKQFDLKSLSTLRSDQGPVFSLYLDLRPSEDALSRFNRLRQQVEQQKRVDHATPDYREQWRAEIARIQRWLEQVPPHQGQGVAQGVTQGAAQGATQGLAVFSGLGAGLWQVFYLPVPVTDRLVVREQPYIRPLEILYSEFGPTLAVLVDPDAARLVAVRLGQADEVTRVQAIPVTGTTLEAGLRAHVRAVIEHTENTWQEEPYAHLVIAGSHEALGLMRSELPEPLSQRLAGELTLAPQTGLEDVLAQVQVIQNEQERQIEARRVQELIRAANIDAANTAAAIYGAAIHGAASTAFDPHTAAVLGLEQTLLAVRAKKVRLLLVEEDFHQEGGECPNCGYLGTGEQGICLFCGMALRPETDIIEVALKRVLEAGGEIDILRSPEMRSTLESYGRIGALLHLNGSRVVKETANQFPISVDGMINPDILHDEAIEESFPASDPPGRQ